MPENNTKAYVRKSRTVLILAHSWPPDANVGAVRPVYLARQLAQHGWTPLVITVKEHHYDLLNTAGISGADSAVVIRTRSIPNPRHFYIWLKKKLGRRFLTSANNPELNTSGGKGNAPIEHPKGRNTLKRILVSLLYTPDEFLGWYPFALFASFRAIRRHRPICIISTAPPFTSHLVAKTISTIFRIPWIADYRDPWSWREGLSPDMSSPVADTINRWLEKSVLQKADRIVCVTPTTSDKYKSLNPNICSNKWVTITNGYDLDEFKKLEPVITDNIFTISYVGTFDFSRSPHLFLKAIGELISEGKVDRNIIRIRFVGPCHMAGDVSVDQMISENHLEGLVRVVGFVPRTDALREIIRADMLLLLGGTQRLSIAAKVYEYIASQNPILAITEDGDTAKIIRNLPMSFVINPTNLDGAKQAIVSCYEGFLLARGNHPRIKSIKSYTFTNCS